MSFSSLGLCDELLMAVSEQGYSTPSPIQAEAIPAALSKRDVMALAQTGTGKTAGFTLPMLQLLVGGATAPSKAIRALVITPTRELAAQVFRSVDIYSSHLSLRSGSAFGGVRVEPQIAVLEAGLDVLVATPGRLLDLHSQQALSFESLEILVLDEADRMLDLGFADEMHRIHELLPKTRQTLMFSATFSDEIKSLAKALLNDPEWIELAAANITVDSVKQKLHPVDKERKTELLIHLIRKSKWSQVLVFSRTKRGADELVAQLKQAGINAASIHANRTQHARTLALDGFRSGEVKVLVATDIASRGIDVSQLPCVINFDLPYVPEDYVHRIGRTGRAGSSGVAVSLFSADESKQLLAVERLIGRQIEREIVHKFEPTKKPAASPHDDEEYGSFEPDAKPGKRGKGKSSKHDRNSWRYQ
ncbi:MAG: DEAD/DEAH box helicase [Oceanococcus sp.]